MKIPFKQAYDLLLSADQVTIAKGEYNEFVSICTSGGNDKDYFIINWESDDGEDYTFDVLRGQNPKVEKKGHKLTFVTCEDTDNEKIELHLFKVTPLV